MINDKEFLKFEEGFFKTYFVLPSEVLVTSKSSMV